MVSALLILAGLLIAVFLGRRLLADRVLVWLLVVSHAVKVALALGFYYVSLWRLPILAEIQRGDGFWTFSRDSFNYHTWGLQIIDAWRLGISLPPMGGEHPMHLYAAALYTVLGSHPLHAVLLNAWYSTFSIVLAVLLVRRFTDQVSTARIVAFLVAFWPSLILWSTQLTKDPLVIFLLLAELYVIVTLWQPLPESPPRRAGRWVAAAFLPFLIHYLRTCVGLMLMVSVVMVFFPVAMFRAVRGEVRPDGRALALSVCIAIGIFLNTRVNLVRLSTPDFPERGHVQLGMQLQAAGQLVPAIAQYRVALQVQEHYPPAYLQLGIALQRQGALAEATAAFEHYLSLTPLGNERQDVTARLVALRRAQGIDEPVVAGSARVSPASPAVSLPEAPPPPPRSVRVRERVTKAVDSLLAVPGRLATMRQGMLNEPGASVVDQHVVVKSATDMARYLPRGFAVVFLSPFPSQWLSRQGDAGPLRLLTGVETLAIYLLMLGAVLSARTSWGRQDEKRWFLLVFIGVSAAAFAIAVPNVGTLFRLRLQLIIPLVILVASTGGFSGYQRSFERLHVIVRRRRSSSPPPNPTSAR